MGLVSSQASSKGLGGALTCAGGSGGMVMCWVESEGSSVGVGDVSPSRRRAYESPATGSVGSAASQLG